MEQSGADSGDGTSETWSAFNVGTAQMVAGRDGPGRGVGGGDLAAGGSRGAASSFAGGVVQADLTGACENGST